MCINKIKYTEERERNLDLCNVPVRVRFSELSSQRHLQPATSLIISTSISRLFVAFVKVRNYMNKTARNKARPSLTLRGMLRISDDPATLVEIQRYRSQIDFLNFSKFPSEISYRGKWDREKAKERRQAHRTKGEGKIRNSVWYQLVAKLSSDIRVKLTGWIPIYLDRCVTSNVTG